MSDKVGTLHSPSNPMAVAREVLTTWQDEQKRPTLRSWRGSWMQWHRTHWAEVDPAGIKATLYRRVEHAVYWQPNSKGEVESKPWAPTRHKIINLLDAVGAVTHLSESVPTPSWIGARSVPAGPIVACANGLLHVPTRELYDLTPDYFNLVSVPFAYDADAGEPGTWLRFLGELWPDDPESIDALQEYFGYVISGRTDLHKILLVVGPTRGGKGTIARILTALVGKGNAVGPTLASIQANFGLAPLIGRSLAIIADARLSGRDTSQIVERLLSISGEDTQTIDRKYRDQWTGRLSTRFVIMSNELPNFGDSSGAIAHRLIGLVLAHSWLGRENVKLEGELLAELPGILNWSLDGLARLDATGRFTEPASSKDAIVAMKDSASPHSAFVRDCCERGPLCEVVMADLWEAWKRWCVENGRDNAGTKQRFGRDLRSVAPGLREYQPPAVDDGPRGKRHYRGIALNQQWETTRSYACTDQDAAPNDDSARIGTRTDPLWAVHDRANGAAPTGDDAAVLAALDSRPLPVYEVAALAAVTRDRAERALKRLHASGHVERIPPENGQPLRWRVLTGGEAA